MPDQDIKAGDVGDLTGRVNRLRVLIIDNFDSFTHNIAHYLRTSGAAVDIDIVRNDERWALTPAYLDRFDAFVLSPGPGHAATPSDVGICRDLLADPTRPVLGVCLGHQLIACLSGVEIVPTAEPMHGRVSLIRHDSSELFAGLPDELSVMRYHSWTIASKLPASLQATAWTQDGEIMAIRHRDNPWWGVQFHPESIGTPFGRRILGNFLDAVRSARVGAQPRGPGRQVHWREVAGSTDPVRLVEAARGQCSVPDAVSLLESSLTVPELARFSYIGIPLSVDEYVVTYDSDVTELTERTLGGELLSRRRLSLFQWLETMLCDVDYPCGKPAFEFHGGWVGWLGYELLRETADVIPGAVSPHPDAAFRSVNTFIAVDHRRDKVYAVVNYPRGSAALDTRVEALLDRLAGVAGMASSPSEPVLPLPGRHRCAPVRFRTRHSDAAYLSLIDKCRTLIRNGESYELCLTNRISTDEGFDPWTLYKHLRTRNPSPYAAFLSIDGVDVVCSSPELFVKVDAEGTVQAKPIKGTVRRGHTSAEDIALSQWLSNNEKDLAENMMIVDLLRHDIASVCIPGTVNVPMLAAIESYPQLHQMVSTITGKLAPGRHIGDVLRSCFPGGSMTGAPKIRSMALLGALEGGPRGLYSGSLGWLSHDGLATLNIVIRSVIAADGTASIGCGGAITYLSVPDDELAEMKLKSRALLGALAETITGDATHFTVEDGLGESG